MKNILVPIGSIENGINNLRYATSFAAMTNARIYVTCIKTLATELILKEVLENVSTKDVQVVSKTISGDIFEGVSQLSKSLKIDLIVLSPQSVEIKDEVYLGKITTKIIRQTDIPLLIVPPNYLFRKIDTILFAFKNSKIETTKASQTLKALIDMFHAKLDLLQVVTPDTSGNDRKIKPELKALMSRDITSENATVFQGIVEHFNALSPEMLCVLRRKDTG
ncbi:MAG: universal stress protein, partial [Bacteroidetes bacterium]|nr:universal stress protein [Bacteroidota bacterium]